MSSIGLRIRTRREEIGLTQTELAEKLGYKSRASINKIEMGKNDITQSRIEEFAKALDTTPAYLMGWEDNIDEKLMNIAQDTVILDRFKQQISVSKIMTEAGGFIPSMVLKPLVGFIPCGDPVEAIQQADEVVEVPASIHCDFALKCRGDSMIGARIHDGDIVYIRIQPDVESGEIAAVMNGDDEATLKRIRKGANTVTLWPENPNYEPSVYSGEALAQLHIVGKAVGFTSVL